MKIIKVSCISNMFCEICKKYNDKINVIYLDNLLYLYCCPHHSKKEIELFFNKNNKPKNQVTIT
jgi:hypothetical protein